MNFVPFSSDLYLFQYKYIYINVTSKFHRDCLSIIGGTNPTIVILLKGVFQINPISVPIRARELIFFKRKLIYELCHTDHTSRHLAPVASPENRSEHFASLCSRISPAHIQWPALKRDGFLNYALKQDGRYIFFI